MRVELEGDHHADVDAKAAEGGPGVVVSHHLHGGAVRTTTVTCTCWDSAGHSHSTSKECPDGGSPLCDCSNPSSPSITC